MVEANALVELPDGLRKPILELEDYEKVLAYNYHKNEYATIDFEKILDKPIKLKDYYLLTHSSNNTEQNNVNSSVYLSGDQIIRVKIGNSNYSNIKITDLSSFLKTYNENKEDVDVFIKVRSSKSSEPLDYAIKYTEDQIFFMNKQKINTFGLYKYENSDEKDFYRIPKNDVFSYIINGVLM